MLRESCSQFQLTRLQECWELIWDNVVAALLIFFNTSKLLKSVNVTSITLIPKVKSPTSVSDLRPILCCYVVYKCITTLLCEKLKPSLSGVDPES